MAQINVKSITTQAPGLFKLSTWKFPNAHRRQSKQEETQFYWNSNRIDNPNEQKDLPTKWNV